MKKTYFTADTHFGHQRIIELCNRPYADVDEMNQAILAGINDTVGEEDRLVILGDIALGKLDSSLPLLAEIRAAEVWLVPGNHDRFSLAYHHKGTEEEQAKKRYDWAHRYIAARGGGSYRTFVLEDEPTSAWRGGIFDLEEPLRDVWLSHYPYDGDSHGEDRYADLRVPDDGVTPIIHGHVHCEWQAKGRQYNVGVDVNDFRPVSEDVLIDWVRSL